MNPTLTKEKSIRLQKLIADLKSLLPNRMKEDINNCRMELKKALKEYKEQSSYDVKLPVINSSNDKVRERIIKESSMVTLSIIYNSLDTEEHKEFLKDKLRGDPGIEEVDMVASMLNIQDSITNLLQSVARGLAETSKIKQGKDRSKLTGKIGIGIIQNKEEIALDLAQNLIHLNNNGKPNEELEQFNINDFKEAIKQVILSIRANKTTIGSNPSLSAQIIGARSAKDFEDIINSMFSQDRENTIQLLNEIKNQ